MSCSGNRLPFACIFILRGIRLLKVIEHGIEVDKGTAFTAVSVFEDFDLKRLGIAVLACMSLFPDKFTDSFFTDFFRLALLIVHAEILQADKNVTGIFNRSRLLEAGEIDRREVIVTVEARYANDGNKNSYYKFIKTYVNLSIFMV